MRRLCLLFASLLVGLSSVHAQRSSEQDLSFIYIAHDENTPVQYLVERLQMAYSDAINYPDEIAVIFYLPNGDVPLCVQVNTKSDNRADFAKIVDELQTKRSHNIEPKTDCQRIQDIFNENDIVDQNGSPLYKSVTWTYYVNSTFWSLQNNEYVIATLCFVMDMEPMIKSGYLKVDVLYSGEYDVLPYDKESPFGSKSLCASVPFMPMPY